MVHSFSLYLYPRKKNPDTSTHFSARKTVVGGEKEEKKNNI